jgi:hypothetical protein
MAWNDDRLTFQIRRANASEWPPTLILSEGEPGIEINTNRFKIGDGFTEWSDLPYVNNDTNIYSDYGIHKYFCGWVTVFQYLKVATITLDYVSGYTGGHTFNTILHIDELRSGGGFYELHVMINVAGAADSSAFDSAVPSISMFLGKRAVTSGFNFHAQVSYASGGTKKVDIYVMGIATDYGIAISSLNKYGHTYATSGNNTIGASISYVNGSSGLLPSPIQGSDIQAFDTIQYRPDGVPKFRNMLATTGSFVLQVDSSGVLRKRTLLQTKTDIGALDSSHGATFMAHGFGELYKPDIPFDPFNYDSPESGQILYLYGKEITQRELHFGFSDGATDWWAINGFVEYHIRDWYRNIPPVGRGIIGFCTDDPSLFYISYVDNGEHKWREFITDANDFLKEWIDSGSYSSRPSTPTFAGKLYVATDKDILSVGVSTSTDPKWIDIFGESVETQTSVTGDTNASLTDRIFLCDTSSASGDVTITLPAASTAKGKEYYVKFVKRGSWDIIIDGNSTEYIDGAQTQGLSSEMESMHIVCDGTKWHILSWYRP